MKRTRTVPPLFLPIVSAAAVVLSSSALAANLSGDALVEALRDGGLVIVMRHASAEREAPAPQRRVPANFAGERQLDEHGRNTMTAMRSAFRRLGIRIGEVHSSPAFRARETAEYLGFGTLQLADQIGAENGDAGWLRAKVSEAPVEGRNTAIITHARNLAEAFGDEAANMQDAEALIYRPDGGNATLVARLQVEEWASLGRD
jgi:phosphohistidine phosphatase SixA